MTNKTKPMLTRETLYHYVDGKMVDGPPSDLTGDTSDLTGDTSDLTGDVSGLSGNVSGLSGNATGLWGDVNKIPPEERPADISEYVKNKGPKT